MEIFPETARKVWNDWELRGLVLLSLTLQVILIVLGNRRKYSAATWVRAVLWATYLSADWVATVALGVLCNGQGDEDPSSHNSGAAGVKAFWAPILLVHLGGPDTITAYSVEDNELWTRHFLGAVVQVGVAFYVFLRSWTSETSNLLVLSVPVFVAGIIKYGERTWALRSASFDRFHGYKTFYRNRRSPDEDPPDDVSNLVAEPYPIAFQYFLNFKNLYRNTVLSFEDTESKLGSSNVLISSDRVFEVIEVELGFMFDALFTKASVIWSSSVAGCILRVSSFICSVGALVAFTLTHKHGCPTIDVVISYVLLAGAVTLEIYATVLLFFSDWAVVWLTDPESRSSLLGPIYGALTTFILAVNDYCWGQQSQKRWSRKVGQVNLISSCIENRRPSKLTYEGLMRFWNNLHEEPPQVLVSAWLMQLIVNHVKSMAINPDSMPKPGYLAEVDPRSQSQSQSQSGMAEVGGPAEVDIQQSQMPLPAKPTPDELLATLINRDKPEGYIRKALEKSDFRELILVFHIATDLCISYWEPECSERYLRFYRDPSELVSNYMVYLLQKRPSMLPGAIGKGKQWYGFTSAETTLLANLRNLRDEGEARNEIQKQIRESRDEPGELSLLVRGCGLAVELGTEKWRRICWVWVEMLCFAAQKCEWRSGHAPQLARGGELLTHVYFLMSHFGLVSREAWFHCRIIPCSART